jgi:hypothetical protein
MNPSPDQTPPNLPAVIVGASRAQDERAVTFQGHHAFKLPPEATLIIIDPYRTIDDPLAQRLVEAGLLTPGAVLVLSPFGTGTYALESEAELAFEREKVQLISQLCQLLGASSVRSDTSTLRIDEDVRKATAGVSKKIGRVTPYKAKGAVTISEKDERRHNLKVADRYPGGAPDLDAARQFVAKHRLGDPEVLGLVTARAGANTLKSRRITVVYEGKQDRNLDIAADVTIPAGTLAGTFRRSRTTRQRVSLDLDIQFPE